MDLQGVGRWALTGLIWLLIAEVAGCLEYGNKVWLSIKYGEFVDLLMNS